MSTCNEIICDVCRRHVDDNGALFIKAKRRWYSWHERGYERVKMCICKRCQDKLYAFMKQEADNG